MYPRPIPVDRVVALPLVMLSIAAGAIHFAVIPEHVAEFAP
jgi:hypothetical protein